MINDMGFDTSTISVCKKIRYLSRLDRIFLDNETKSSPQSKHLFEYIDFCGKDVLEFVKACLSNLQPYMIVKNQNQGSDERCLCVIDNRYAVLLEVKINKIQQEEVVVSFLENNTRNIDELNWKLNPTQNQLVPVFADRVNSWVIGTDNYVVRVMVQRGMLTLPLNLSGKKCADVFWVRKFTMEKELINYCNEYLRDLYTSNLPLNFDQIVFSSRLQQISFPAYGKDTFSVLSLLVENLCVLSDKLSRSAADFALTTYMQSLILTEEQKEELCSLLQDRFQVTTYDKIDIVLKYIEFRMNTLPQELIAN